jgi:DNA-binding transcriptional MerR regulator
MAEGGEEADEPVWSAGTLATHLGVSVVTLRSWSRRYGLDPAGHVSGQHRRYQARDVARPETMRQLIAAGMASADAARWVQTHPPGFTETPPRSGAEGLSSGNPGLLPARDDLVADTDRTRNEDSVAAARAVRALLLAACRLDSDTVPVPWTVNLAHRGADCPRT